MRNTLMMLRNSNSTMTGHASLQPYGGFSRHAAQMHIAAQFQGGWIHTMWGMIWPSSDFPCLPKIRQDICYFNIDIYEDSCIMWEPCC